MTEAEIDQVVKDLSEKTVYRVERCLDLVSFTDSANLIFTAHNLSMNFGIYMSVPIDMVMDDKFDLAEWVRLEMEREMAYFYAKRSIDGYGSEE